MNLKFPELQKTHNFIINNIDTDSILICKNDQTEFSEQEQKELLKEINNFMPEKIIFAADGYFESVIILRTKNYVLKEKGKPPKYKGSALKSPNKEKRLNQFIKDIIKELGIGRNDFETVYNRYVKEIDNITDISQWVTKKTITDKVLTNERANESNVRDALEGTEYAEGDKKYIFFNEEDKVTLQENFNGGYSKDRLYAKLYATTKVFEEILDREIFLNYKLKRNKKKLEEILNGKE